MTHVPVSSTLDRVRAPSDLKVVNVKETVLVGRRPLVEGRWH